MQVKQEQGDPGIEIDRVSAHRAAQKQEHFSLK